MKNTKSLAEATMPKDLTDMLGKEDELTGEELKEYNDTHSECCDALIINGFCGNCHEHC